MPLATVHLLALASNATISSYLNELRSSSIKPLVVSKAIRWIIKPEKLSVVRLLDSNWDLLIIVPTASPLPATCLSKDWIASHWTITAGVPGSLINGFHERNNRLLHPHQGDVPALTGSILMPRMAGSTQNLELNEELLRWSTYIDW